ncbi:intercellular adhesion molecule 5-like [Eublepharis macularius]|uniref:Intercellular adhesion molecule 5-like n=1 Tax=Eublepharis macularius TaxID=481883 RepID=A0AA97KR19_EUBMA|nr:intercellular adhesion molecule 5-like [Eublepharis macularius]
MLQLLCVLLASAAAAAAAQEAQEQPFVSAWPENPVVEFGSSLVLNCSTNCKNIRDGGLETNLDKKDEGEGPTWKAFRLFNVSNWDSAPSCYFDCGEDVDMKPHRVNFTVYRVPELVELDPVPVMEVGKNYTLTCRVSSMAPIRNLSVAFLQGGKRLHLQTFEKHAAREASDVVVTHIVTAHQADRGEEISCHAALDLRPEGQLFGQASLNQSLETVDFPVNPQLRPLRYMEVNTSETVTCEVTGVFPAEEAQFEMTFAEERLNLSVTVVGDVARAQAQVSSSIAGSHTLKCTVSLGPVTKTAEENVNVYCLPDLVLTLSPQETFVNEAVEVACYDAHPEATQSPPFSAHIRNSRGVLESRDSLPFRVSVTTTEEDDGQEFTCQVDTEIDGRPIRRKTSSSLTVFYGPQMNDSSCPGALTWKADSKEAFRCSAWGNPPPTVECRKHDVPYAIGMPQLVTKDHQGSYNCSASNWLGSVAKLVVVNVESDEPPTLLIILVILSLASLASAAGVGYYMYYKGHKCGKYRLPRKAKGNPSEEKHLNGSIQTDSV